MGIMDSKGFLISLKLKQAIVIPLFFLTIICVLPTLAFSNPDSQIIDATNSDECKVELVKQLLDGGVNVDSQDGRGFTALIYAAARGHEKCVKLLLEHGADINKRNQEGGTALMYSVGNAHISTTEFLLSKGANVNAVAYDGDSSLDIALRKSHKRTASILYKYGADEKQTLYLYKNTNGGNVYTNTIKDIPDEYRNNVIALEYQEYNPAGAREYEKQYLADMENFETEKKIKQKYKNQKDAVSEAYDKMRDRRYSGSWGQELDKEEKKLIEIIEKNEKEALANPETYKRREAYSNSPEGKLENRISDLEYKQQRMKSQQDLEKIIGK